MNRRKVLLGSGIILTTALAGCSSDETNGNGSDDGDENENGNENENREENGSADVELPDQPEIEIEDTNPDDAATSLTIS